MMDFSAPDCPEQTAHREMIVQLILDSIVVSIPACHAGDRGSIPRRGGALFASSF